MHGVPAAGTVVVIFIVAVHSAFCLYILCLVVLECCYSNRTQDLAPRYIREGKTTTMAYVLCIYNVYYIISLYNTLHVITNHKHRTQPICTLHIYI